jgi:pyruvate,water dikinase
VEARRVAYGFNDDNTLVLYSVPLGLVRRAVLEVGRRLAERGRLVDAEDAFEATTAELAELLAGDGPSADALSARAAERRSMAAVEPPPAVGTPIESPRVELPDPVRRLARLTSAWWASASASDADPARAAATVGTQAVRGRALVVADPIDAIIRLEPGDVLVASTTYATYNTIFPLVAAVAVEHGGAMSHAAILARELGVPAVIGVPGLLGRIVDGDHVEVDPTAGTITVLSGRAT